MSRNTAALAVVLLAAAGCVNTEYIGKSYPPTQRVDLYFDKADIKVDHEVMGRIKSTADDFISFEDVQADMEAKAMEKGADALLIEGMGTIDVGSTTNTSSESETKPRYKKNKDGTYSQTGTVEKSSSSSSTTVEKNKLVTGVLIKYRK